MAHAFVDLFTKFAKTQKVVVIMLKNGERHQLKITGVEGDVVVGEARCIQHSHDIGKKIHLHAVEEGEKNVINLPEGMKGLTMADAIDKFGAEAHRYRFYVTMDQIQMVAEDSDDAFDETPYFPGLI